MSIRASKPVTEYVTAEYSHREIEASHRALSEGFLIPLHAEGAMTCSRRLSIAVATTALLALGLFIDLPRAFGQESLTGLLKANPEWVGFVRVLRTGRPPTYENVPIDITFHVAGEPPMLHRVSHRWNKGSEIDATEVKLTSRGIEFSIPPPERKLRYNLVLSEGALKGNFRGRNRQGTADFDDAVELKPKR
jgi:hypothetical protein